MLGFIGVNRWLTRVYSGVALLSPKGAVWSLDRAHGMHFSIGASSWVGTASGAPAGRHGIARGVSPWNAESFPEEPCKGGTEKSGRS